MASKKKERFSSHNTGDEVEDNDFYNAEEDFDDWGNFGLTQDSTCENTMDSHHRGEEEEKKDVMVDEFHESEEKEEDDSPLEGSSYEEELEVAVEYRDRKRGRMSDSKQEREKRRKLAYNRRNLKDAVHGLITFEGLCIDIIDSPEFQRLRYLRQLGNTHRVYSSANHTRFEHSLGVAYLAEKLVLHLKSEQKKLLECITSIDILCVKVAGLCHDLGHGPFSHLFDCEFMPRVQKKLEGQTGKKVEKWTHEEQSIRMLNSILDRIDWRKYGLTDVDKCFIEECILGTPEEERKGGRTGVKEFLYDIVNNSRSGADVDKMDYFKRDCRNTKDDTKVELERFLFEARVVKAVDGDNFDYMICFPEKCWSDAYEFFHTRYVMHRDVYSHKTCKKIDFMVSDILEKADDYVLLPGKVGPDGKVKRYKISECHQDPAAYCLLRDDILSLILLTDDPNLAEAKSLIECIESRKLYSSVGRMSWIEAFNGKGKEDIEEEIVGTVDGLLRKGDLIIEFLDLHHGRGDENPLRELRFFTKNATSKDVAKVMRQKNEEDWGATLPRRFRDRFLRVYCRNPAKDAIAQEAFRLWAGTQRPNTPI